MREPKRIELHCHSFLSDGTLLPSELLRRVSVMDHEAVAITDHVDASNMAQVITSLQRVLYEQPEDFGTRLLVGVELTHVGPDSICRLATKAKALGAEWVVVHGETPVEPVAPGTNRAAVECEAVDLLAHPGFLTLEEAKLAAARGCLVEITARKGHSLTNGHVTRMCTQAGALMVVDTDSHEPDDFISLSFAQRVAAGAGLDPRQVSEATITNPQAVLARILGARSR
ncbi:MAG: histidinol phosphate phosphatase domain-containing protein [Anaerolineae bacterium]